MCSYDTEILEVKGSYKANGKWHELQKIVIYFDHPTYRLEAHTLNIDILEKAEEGRSIAIELPLEVAEKLARSINQLVERNNKILNNQKS